MRRLSVNEIQMLRFSVKLSFTFLLTSKDDASSLLDLEGGPPASSPEPDAAAAAAAAAGGKGADDPFGEPNEPNCMDKKYLVAACLSCSRSSAV